MRVNGKEETQGAGLTLEEYLKTKGYESSRVAVELNGEIVPRSHFSETVLRQEDALEIVSFVGGG